VELQTIGSKSGEPRTVMLTSPIHDEGRVVLIASKGGDSRDPQWYRNLTVHPDVRVTMHGETRAMRARTASPEEKAALWPDIVAVYKGYDSYQKKAGRDIPVVICEPLPA
jgi:deazaflavin-dependent oxidoreductase (nitroreductase family)